MSRNASRKRIAGLLAAAGSVHLTTHRDPDPDGIGSMLALRRLLQGDGRRVRCFSPSPAPSQYGFLPGSGGIEVLEDFERAARIAPADVLVACDCADRERMGAPARLRRGVLVNLDHHASNDRFGDYDLVDGRASCTAVLVDGLRRALGVPLDAATATCLYAAVVFDTGRFLHENTDAATFRFAARLAAAGVDTAAVGRELYGSRSEHDLAVEALCLAHLERDRREPRIAGIALSAADIAAVGAPEDWGDLVEIPRSLAGVELAFLLREAVVDGGRQVRVSLRSNRPYTVGPVAAACGGGGHPLAAGCTVAGDLAAVRRRVLRLLRQQCIAERPKGAKHGR